MRRLAVLATVIAVGCSGGQAPVPETKVNVPQGGASPKPGRVFAPVRVVDLGGNPLSGILPIVTTQPNAFDEPLRKGQATDAHGSSAVEIPPGQRVFVRGWDPALRRFANNYIEVPAAASGQTTQLTLVMVSGASLAATLVSDTGAPVAGTAVHLLMSHPKEGPWWPATATTDDQGNVRFESVPAGTYNVSIEANGVGRIEIPKLELAPGANLRLGPVVLGRTVGTVTGDEAR